MDKNPVNLKLVSVLVVILATLFTCLAMTERGVIVDIPLQFITGEAIADARSALINDIAAGRNDIGITLPPLSFAYAGDSTAGVELIFRNREPNPRCYIFDIGLTAVDSPVSFAYLTREDCLDSSCPGFPIMKRDAEGWFLMQPNALPIGAQGTAQLTVYLGIPEGANAGGYVFTVYAYPADPLLPPGECRPGLDESHADPRSPPRTTTFRIEVRSRI